MSPSGTTPRAIRPSIPRLLTVGTAAYGGWLISNIVLALLMPFLAVIRFALGHRGRRFTRFVIVSFLRHFFLGYFHWIRVYRVQSLPRKEDLPRQRPCLFVANHRSWIDALILTAILEDVVIPVNAAYLKIPLAGTMMRWLGAISLEKSSRRSLLDGAESVRGALRNGQSVVVFPEGTRSPMGQVKHFSDFFFRIAIDEGVPIIPTIIHLGVPFLGPGKENFLTARRAGLKIVLLEPEVVKRGARGADLARRVHKTMTKSIARLDAQSLAPTQRSADEIHEIDDSCTSRNRKN